MTGQVAWMIIMFIMIIAIGSILVRIMYVSSMRGQELDRMKATVTELQDQDIKLKKSFADGNNVVSAEVDDVRNDTSRLFLKIESTHAKLEDIFGTLRDFENGITTQTMDVGSNMKIGETLIFGTSDRTRTLENKPDFLQLSLSDNAADSLQIWGKGCPSYVDPSECTKGVRHRFGADGSVLHWGGLSVGPGSNGQSIGIATLGDASSRYALHFHGLEGPVRQGMGIGPVDSWATQSGNPPMFPARAGQTLATTIRADDDVTIFSKKLDGPGFDMLYTVQGDTGNAYHKGDVTAQSFKALSGLEVGEHSAVRGWDIKASIATPGIFKGTSFCIKGTSNDPDVCLGKEDFEKIKSLSMGS